MRRTLPPALRAALRPTPTFRSRPCRLTPSKRALISAASIQFGQPLHETHPHLIEAGDLTPGISALEYHHRRAALARKLPKNSVAVLAASEVKYRSGAVFYEFRQDSNFFYLTGFNEPNAVAIIAKGTSDVEYTFHLYVRPKDAYAELWDGARSGVQAAQDVFNADEAGDIDSISRIVPSILSSASQIYTDIGRNSSRKSAFERFLHPNTNDTPTAFAKYSPKPLRPLINDLRLTKSTAELHNMRIAGQRSGEVLTSAMKSLPDSESQLWANITHGFKSAGLAGEAYVPVVAGGGNALSIHYTRNDALLTSGEVVLVDAGGEYGGYITDITRTWPVCGRFTDAQKDMYAMILSVQKDCISLCREDAAMSLDSIHSTCESGLRDGLKALGFDVRGDTLQRLFPHHVGHHVGLDVHDASGYSRTEVLKEGMCITIEPGVYVPNEDRWPEKFRGLGIRIEDSVVVGKGEVEVLTGTAVKEVGEVEWGK
ncbi:unnamed protein product [Zymoseptoria tritici ST99CH_3D1]|nr:unnamed protein product [Zymoseptoria tritici ST99CH_3D1]